MAGLGVLLNLTEEVIVHPKTLFAASAFVLAAATGAMAADVPVEEPVPVVEEPLFTWTGFYVGIQGGYVWTDFDGDLDGGIDGDFDSLDGGLFGGYVGYNFQYGAWVFGAEGDFNGVWNDDDFTVSGVPGVPTFTVSPDTSWLASLRARVGYSWDRALFFATGGVAWTQANADVTVVGGPAFSFEETFTGWTLGAGVEYAFTDNWLGRVEYRYYGFDDEDFGPGPLGNVDFDTQTITAGIAYKF
jgi:outer membrane immunogenic protein